MDKFTYVAPHPVYLDYLALNLRKADLEELRAASGTHIAPGDILRTARAISDVCEVGLSRETGLPALVRGVAPLGGGVGVIWMVATDELNDSPRYLVEEGKRFVTRNLERYELLYNHVDVRNTGSLNWLEHIGATFDPPAPFGPYGMPFRRFEWRRSGGACPPANPVI